MFPSIGFHSKYEQQIFFSFLDSSDTTIPFNLKNGKHSFTLDCLLIHLKIDEEGNVYYSSDDEKLFDKLQQTITYKTRIYFLGHGKPGSSFLVGSNGRVKISAKQLARFVSLKILSGLPKTAGFLPLQNRLKISLLVCDAGLPNTSTPTLPNHINNSFAAQLLYAFRIYDIKNIVIAARLGVLSSGNRFYIIKNSMKETYNESHANLTNSDTQLSQKFLSSTRNTIQKFYLQTLLMQQNVKHTELLNRSSYQSKSNAAKVLYYNVDDITQSITKAYQAQPNVYDWREDVLDTINACILDAVDIEQKQGLCLLLNELFLLEEDILMYSLLEYILQNEAEPNPYKISKIINPLIFYKLNCLFDRYIDKTA